MVKAIGKSRLFFSLDKGQTKEQEYQRFFHFCIFSQPEGIVMPFQIRPLTTAERDTPFVVPANYFLFSVGFSRPFRPTTDNLVSNILVQLEASDLLPSCEDHPFVGLTMMCNGSHPYRAYAWSFPDALRSPLDTPPTFVALITTDNTQQVFDDMIDLCSEETLRTMIDTLEDTVRREKIDETASALRAEAHRKSIPPDRVASEDRSFIHRAEELRKAQENLHDRTEADTKTLIFLQKILIRRSVSAEERDSDYRLAKRHNNLFKNDRSPPTPRP